MIPYICSKCGEVKTFCPTNPCPLCGGSFKKRDIYLVNYETGERTEFPSITPYDDLTEKEYDELAQESYDNLVRSTVEAGGEMRVARELLSRSLEMLCLLGYDSSFTNSSIDTLTKDIKEFLGGQ